jgi:diacylglycerol O-acyltransferase
MRAVAFLDQLFLWLERDRQPMHVGALVVVSPSEAPHSFVERVLDEARAATKATGPFGRRPVRRLGRWYWDEVAALDIDAHVHEHALEEASLEDALHRAVSKLHALPLDRAKPLWEMHLFTGLAGGQVAVYVKVHHALTDGVGLSRLLTRAGGKPFWALPAREKQKKERAPMRPISIFQSIPRVARELGRAMVEREAVRPFDAPPSKLNQKVSRDRTFIATDWSLERLRRTSSGLGITLNDLLLAMCGSALRSFLLAEDALPKDPLVAMVPVALKDGPAEGNAVTLLLADLSTNLADPSARLQATRGSVRIAKERVARMSGLENMAFVSAASGPTCLNTLSGGPLQGFNVVISNVPGPTEALSFAGARVEQVVPVSIAFDGQAMNLTFTSYADRLSLGIIACPIALPNVDALLPHLDAALAELESLAVAARAA